MGLIYTKDNGAGWLAIVQGYSWQKLWPAGLI
jgi:hypothetical protein